MLSIDMIVTIVMFVVFIGIVIWAWSPSRKQDFEEASNLALEPDDNSPDSTAKREGQDNG